jgi:hypothetical protein
MIPVDRLEFLCRALGLSHSGELAAALGVTTSHISNIFAQRDTPSRELLARFELLLQDAFRKRDGQTIPPEVQRIVFEMLWPPPPFDPTKRGPGRPRKIKGEDNGSTEPESRGVGVSGSSSGDVRASSRRHAGDDSKQLHPRSLDTGPTECNSRFEAGYRNASGGEHGGGFVSPDKQVEGDGEFGANDFSRIEEAVRVYNLIEGNVPRRYYDAVRAQASAWLGKSDSDGAILTKIKRAGGKRRRTRQKNPGVQNRNALLIEVMQPVPWLMKQWGARGGDYAKLSDRACMLEVVRRDPELSQRLLRINGGAMPSLDMLSRIYRQAFGTADRREDAEREHIFETLNYRGEFAGQICAYDAFAVNVSIEGEWGERGRPTGGHRKGWIQRWVYLCVDIESGCVWLFSRAGRAEVNHWSDAMVDFAFRHNWIPQFELSDEISGLFGAGRHVKPGGDLPYFEGVLLHLGLGVAGSAHKPKRPTGGSYVEAAVKCVRAAFRTLDGLRTIDRHRHLEGLPVDAHKVAWFASEQEFLEFIPLVEAEANRRLLSRAGRPRADLWTGHDASVAWRGSRPVNHEHWMEIVDDGGYRLPRWRHIIKRARACEIHNRIIVGRMDGQKLTAELTKDSPLDAKPDGWPAICIPSGLVPGADPETCVVTIIEPRMGQPKYHTAVASTATNFFGNRLLKPIFGTEIKGKPWGEKDHDGNARDVAASKYAKQLKTGTYDAPVTTGPATPEDCYRPE